jgi:acetyltransferase-like isoleucine patch superfamily enzyme/glycosyltransferase involved in cell wall biosynthesis
MASQPSLEFRSNEKLLSLCIPTYNRAACLHQQFLRLLTLSKEELEGIEIIISDNCSTDETEQIVHQFQDKIVFKYFRNNENIGPDGNFLQCLQKSTGKYVWLLGDDDFLRTEHISALLSILANEDLGLIHVGAPNNGKFYRIYEDDDNFMSDIGVMITFMSANIFRRETIQQMDFNKYRNTNLLQVPMYFSAAFASKKNAILHRVFYDPATVAASNGGYNLIRVFVKNLSEILDEFEEKGLSPHSAIVIRNRASDFIFPFILNYMILKRKNNFDTKNGWSLLNQYLGYHRVVISAIKFFSSPRQNCRFAVKFFRFLKKYLMIAFGRLSLLVFPHCLAHQFKLFKDGIISNRFAYSTPTHHKCAVQGPLYLIGGKYIHMGKNFCSCPGLRIECFKVNVNDPQLIIGDDVKLNFNVHIGVINRVSIGNRVLMGSNILITDHSHGQTDKDSLETPPNLRPLYSKGAVTIEDDVWIGENAVIMPNVTIGHNSIIGANAVITKDVAPFSKVAGNPAHIIS